MESDMNEKKKNGNSIAAGFFLLLFLTAADQLTKYLAASTLKGTSGISLIPHVFELFYLENRGAAFGIFANRQWFFIMIALVILAVAVYIYILLPQDRYYHPLRLCALLVGAGAIGNMIDRIVHHYVIDFLYFSLIDFPVFNVADCYVVIGAVLLILLLFTKYRSDHFEFLDPRKD